jgi:hypothetical protein
LRVLILPLNLYPKKEIFFFRGILRKYANIYFLKYETAKLVHLDQNCTGFKIDIIINATKLVKIINFIDNQSARFYEQIATHSVP